MRPGTGLTECVSSHGCGHIDPNWHVYPLNLVSGGAEPRWEADPHVVVWLCLGRSVGSVSVL